MEVAYLGIVFAVIVAVLWLKKPLFLAMMAGIVVAIVLFKIEPGTAARILWDQTKSRETIELLLSFYIIMFLQLMLDKRGRLASAKDSFNRLIRNRRLNTMIPPAIVGLLPSAAVMTIAADMVDKSCEDHLSAKDKTFVACFYRHIPEMFLPTFPVILLGIALSGQNAGLFIVLMLPLVIVACALPYLVYLRKIPREMAPISGEVNKAAEFANLIRSLWSLIAVFVLIVALNLPMTIVGPIVIVAYFFADRFKIGEVPDLAVRSIEILMLGNMYLVMLFKGILSYTGVLALLPDFFGQFPIPLVVSFCLLFFVGTIIAGSQAIIALCLPMVYTAFPDGGIPMLVMFMGIAWAAMQISPTHVCSFVAAGFFKTSLWDIIVRGFPIAAIYAVIAYGYYELLKIFF